MINFLNGDPFAPLFFLSKKYMFCIHKKKIKSL